VHVFALYRLDQGYPGFLYKQPQRLLWAGLWATNVKVTICGIPNIHRATQHNLAGHGLDTHGIDSPALLRKYYIRILTHALTTRISVTSKENWSSGLALRTAHAFRCRVGWKSKKNLTKVSAGIQIDCLSRDNKLRFWKVTFFCSLWHCGPTQAFASSFGRAQLDEWPARRRSGFGDLVVSMLASGTQVRGFRPGLSRRIFRAKNSSSCLPSEGK
jgi:hypothetical protein